MSSAAEDKENCGPASVPGKLASGGRCLSVGRRPLQRRDNATPLRLTTLMESGSALKEAPSSQKEPAKQASTTRCSRIRGSRAPLAAGTDPAFAPFCRAATTRRRPQRNSLRRNQNWAAATAVVG